MLRHAIALDIEGAGGGGAGGGGRGALGSDFRSWKMSLSDRWCYFNEEFVNKYNL